MSCHCSGTVQNFTGVRPDIKHVQPVHDISPDAVGSTNCKPCTSGRNSVRKRKAGVCMLESEDQLRHLSMDMKSGLGSSISSQEKHDHSAGPMDLTTQQPIQTTKSMQQSMQESKPLPVPLIGPTGLKSPGCSLTFVRNPSTHLLEDPTYYSLPCALKGSRIIGGLVRTSQNSTSTGSSIPMQSTPSKPLPPLSSVIGQPLSRRDMIQSQLDMLRSHQQNWTQTTSFAQVVRMSGAHY